MHIKVDNISKHYKEVTAVNRLSFEVQQGEVFALLGPNGAGKSSLVRMLVGSRRPMKGKLLLMSMVKHIRLSLLQNLVIYLKIAAFI